MAFGIIGLGVMGRNLALNMADKGIQVSLHDLWHEAIVTTKSDPQFNQDNITFFADLQQFVESLSRPRRILLLVKAGETVDAHIGKLLPYLEAGDCVIDGGNSHYEETQRRNDYLKDRGMLFVGLGVSGGETGARHGPSLMAGASEDAYDLIAPVFGKIAARAKSDNEACFALLGRAGAGHFVKTVHNGIEYADMQLIAEIASFFINKMGLTPLQCGEIFENWNKGPLASYLVEITGKLLKVDDEDSGEPLINFILDQAGQKGTGRWTAEATLKYGVAAPSLMEAVAARALSAIGDIRKEAESALGDSSHISTEQVELSESLLREIETAMLVCKFAIYAQGMAIIAEASETHDWQIDLEETAKIWRAGCIIRADLLEDISCAYGANLPPKNLLLAPAILSKVKGGLPQLRQLAGRMVANAHPSPVLLSTLSYIEGLFTARGSANIIQAQRDFFGAHTYKRVDKEGDFHTEWEK
ncbi:MAG: NADP-dependent phosphogluconate dehydrogenase [Alphaproteobacteria bacterium]|nr:NADP-dependent phosphogluconate dehydrogenase [Alphaproteobacteria bacterium]